MEAEFKVTEKDLFDRAYPWFELWMANNFRVGETSAFDVWKAAQCAPHMAKPSWKDAPDFAKYLAMDANGHWYWFAIEPHIFNDGRWSGGRTEFAGSFVPEWELSREKRP